MSDLYRDHLTQSCYGARYSDDDVECESCFDSASCKIDTRANTRSSRSPKITSSSYTSYSDYDDGAPCESLEACWGYYEVGHPICSKCDYRWKCKKKTNDSGKTTHYQKPFSRRVHEPLNIKVDTTAPAPRTFMEIFRELLLILIEKAIAAAGYTLAEYFSTRRFA